MNKTPSHLHKKGDEVNHPTGLDLRDHSTGLLYYTPCVSFQDLPTRHPASSESLPCATLAHHGHRLTRT